MNRNYELLKLGLEKQSIPAGIDTEECDPDEDEGCLEAQQAQATKEKEAAKNVAMRKGSLIEWQFTFPIRKANPNDPSQDPSLLYGIIYPSCEQGAGVCPLDTQGDFASSEDVKNAAHGFLEKYGQGRARVTVEHGSRAKASVVQSYIALDTTPLPNGDIAQKGSWIGAVKVNDPALMKAIDRGDYQAFSIGGTGTRISNPSQIAKSSAVKGPTQLVGLDIDELSIVGRGANMRKFAIVRKTEDEMMDENEYEGNEELLKSDIKVLLDARADELVQKSDGQITKEQAWDYAAHTERPDLAAILLPSGDLAGPTDDYAIHKAEDLSQEQAWAIPIVEDLVSEQKQSAYPEVYKWLEQAQTRVAKSNGAVTLEQAYADAVHEDSEGYTDHVRKTSALRF